ncbi:uncharacterized protein LOC114240967 [Bombyx mandarina]|uniref:Uncharacterized protein LOC114240967 n=1 Tax=Bombyx mandarina TaxID=7092 RepID=A0A6J2JDS3_BOMMA|nr:uncharacterized protein LOC114240967 [Bombyx mandarina]
MSLDVNISEPDEFNCEELHESIKVVAALRGIQDFVYHVDYICGKGDNFIANIFRVSVKEANSENNTVGVIVKTLVNTTRQELFHELHKKEVEFYRVVISKFNEIQETLAEAAKLILPRCLYWKIEKSNEVLILEDMLLYGFVLDSKPKHEVLDFEQCSLVISELAKFHALSFVCGEREKESFSKIKSDFSDIIYQDHFLDKSKLKNYFLESFDMSLSVVTDVKAHKVLEEIKPSILKILQCFSKASKTNVLCHGDCWINNILFKYEERKPARVCFIDFQAVRYANPVTDIMYFIYLCTDSKFRSDNFERLLKIYYDSLKSFLSLYEIDADIAYPEVEFKSDVNDHLIFGLLISMIDLRIIIMTPEHEAILKGSNIVDGSNTGEVPGEMDYFKIRVNDVVDEAISNGSLMKLSDKINNLL